MSYLNPSVPNASKYRKSGSAHFAQSGFAVSSLDDYAQTDPKFFQSTSFSDTSPTEFGLEANKSIPYHISAITNNQGQLSPGALMFAFRSARGFGMTVPDGARYVDDLIGLNGWLEMNSHRKELASVDAVVKQFTFMGVLQSQITNQLRKRNDDTFIMNNVVAMRASVVNVWGTEAREGSPLYLIVKKVRTRDNKLVWRFVPYAHLQQTYPPLSALLCGVKEGETPELGHAIFIGTAMSTPTAFAEGNEDILNSPNAARLAVYAGGIDVCIAV